MTKDFQTKKKVCSRNDRIFFHGLPPKKYSQTILNSTLLEFKTFNSQSDDLNLITKNTHFSLYYSTQKLKQWTLYLFN